MAIPPLTRNDPILEPSFISRLPLEIIELILFHLPKRHLVLCSLASKEWRKISDTSSLWLQFTQQLGLSLKPTLSPTKEYGKAYRALSRNLLKFEVFGDCQALARKEELLFLKQPRGIRVFDLQKGQESFFVPRHRTVDYGMAISHEYLILVTEGENYEYKFDFLCFRQTTFLFSCTQKRQFPAYFIWKHFLIHVDVNKIITRKINELGSIVSTYVHLDSIIFFHKTADLLISLDSCFKLRAWDLNAEELLCEVKLHLPKGFHQVNEVKVGFTLQGGELLLLTSQADEIPKAIRLSEVFLGSDKIYLQFRSVRKIPWIVVFKKTGGFQRFFEGKISLLSPNIKEVGVIEKKENDSIPDLFFPILGKAPHSMYRLLIVSNFKNLVDLYDLKTKVLLQKDILYYQKSNKRIITIKEGELSEWDAVTTERVRQIALSSPSCHGERDEDVYSKRIEDESFVIDIRGKSVTVSFRNFSHSPQKFQVEDPKRDIQVFEGRVAVLTEAKQLYIPLFGKMTLHPQSFKKITSYGENLLCDTETERTIVNWINPFPRSKPRFFGNMRLPAPFCDYSFRNGKVVRVTNAKIDIWNVDTEESFSLNRTYDFPIEEMVVKNECLLEIFIDTEKSNGIVIWDLNLKTTVHFSYSITKYLILGDFLVCWNRENTIEIWDLERGKFLTQILRPGHFPVDQVFYVIGNELITHSGKMDRGFNFSEPKEIFLYSPLNNSS